jgi:hypothetical protein
MVWPAAASKHTAPRAEVPTDRRNAHLTGTGRLVSSVCVVAAAVQRKSDRALQQKPETRRAGGPAPGT